MSATELFTATYSRPPEGLFAAPGRVNLIGEHTDYTGGLVLPFAIDASATLAIARNTDDVVRVVSAQRPGPVQMFSNEDLHPHSPAAGSWPGYLLGAVWALRQAGHAVGGLDLALDSQVPSGAGLSSSAAVECVTTLAAASVSGIALEPLQIAALSLRAENDFVGVPCGPMDQTASAAARAGSVLLFDTRAGTVEYVPFNPAAENLGLLVIDTRVTHSLSDGEYAKRRADCEKAVDILGVNSLRDITPEVLPIALDKLDDPVLARRVSHVVTENSRVASTVEFLRAGNLHAIGELLTASHRSLQHDYEVSCPELDVAVNACLGSGALGARMTGGGFGGSAIALIPSNLVGQSIRAVLAAFDQHGFAEPVPRMVNPSDGARSVSQG
ncbi:MAG: galactokinase [Nakamurella sp.]